MGLYYGIKQAYPRLREFVGTTVPAVIQNARPYTLLAPMIGGLGVMLGAGAFTGSYPLADMVLAAVVLAILNGAGNNVNSIYDKPIDEVNKPYRPLVQGTLTKDGVYSIALVMYVGAAMLASLVNVWFMGFMFILFLFSVYYSVPPVRAKQRLWVNNIWQAASRGLFGTVAAWSVVADPLSVIPWAFGSVTGVWMLAAQTTKDFPDIEGDREYGVRTLPVHYGRESAKRLMYPILLASFILLNIYTGLGVLPTVFVAFNLLLIPSLIIVPGVDMEWSLMENNVGWVSMYATLTLWYVGFPVVTSLL